MVSRSPSTKLDSSSLLFPRIGKLLVLAFETVQYLTDRNTGRIVFHGLPPYLAQLIAHHLAAGGVFSCLNGLANDGHHLRRQRDADLLDIRHREDSSIW